MNSVFKITSVLEDPETGKIKAVEFELRHTDDQFPGTEIMQVGVVPLSKPLAANASDATIIADLVAQGVCQSPENAQFVFEQMAFQYAMNTMNKVSRVPEPVVVPQVITDRQFFAVLEGMGRITYDEALQAVKTGDLPAAFNAFLGSLPQEKQKSYRLFMEGEKTFSRDHPVTEDLASFFGMSSAEVDQIFIQGNKL